MALSLQAQLAHPADSGAKPIVIRVGQLLDGKGGRVGNPLEFL